MDPEKFYGSTKRKKYENVVQKALFFSNNPVSVSPVTGILNETKIYKTFHKQDEALNFMWKNGMGLMTFSYETPGDRGCRRFVVAHPNIYWDNLQARPPQNRCSYEVIPNSTRCKLYFDIEFFSKHKPLSEGPNITKQFIDLVIYYIFKIFKIDYSISDVLTLDSSTSLKFSRHLIFVNEQLIFKDNIEAGNFVKYICLQIKNASEEIPKEVLACLQMNNDKGKYTTFCDEGVYTKNRNFRLFNCTKYGKNTPLKVSLNDFYSRQRSSSDKEIFLKSLVTHIVQDNNNGLTFFHEDNSQTKCTPQLKTSRKYIAISSAYPEIDSYILSILPGAFIRSTQYFNNTDTIVYEVGKNRFCHNIKREHKSNGVMYVVNLRKGIYYQKCHDPECFGFKSEEVNLPRHTMPWMQFLEDETEKPNECISDDIDDDTLLQVALTMGI